MNTALGRVIASVPESMVMDANPVSANTDPGVPAHMKSLVSGANIVQGDAGMSEVEAEIEAETSAVLDACLSGDPKSK
eukprot:11934128-Alexandrium_andersonii.AAC.1